MPITKTKTNKATKAAKASPAKLAKASVKASKAPKSTQAEIDAKAAAKAAMQAARVHTIPGGCTYKAAFGIDAKKTGNFLGAKKHLPVMLGKACKSQTTRDLAFLFDIRRVYAKKQFQRRDIDAGIAGRALTWGSIKHVSGDLASIQCEFELTDTGYQAGANKPSVNTL